MFHRQVKTQLRYEEENDGIESVGCRAFENERHSETELRGFPQFRKSGRREIHNHRIERRQHFAVEVIKSSASDATPGWMIAYPMDSLKTGKETTT